MKNSPLNFIKKYWFIFCFAAVLAVPLYGKLLDNGKSLIGVTKQETGVEPGLETLGDGSYQSSLSSRWDSSFPGVVFLTRLRNQILYSTFAESPNTNVVIGKDGELFEPWYIYDQLQYAGPLSEEAMDDLIGRLVSFRDLAEANGKEVYLYLTPTKTMFEEEKIPSRYFLIDQRENYDDTNYSLFTKKAAEAGLSLFDGASFAREHEKELSSPVFGKTGTHWRTPWFSYTATGLQDFIAERSRYDLSTVKISEVPAEGPVGADADIYNILNLMKEPEGVFYGAEMSVKEEGTDRPSVFARGGSFMGSGIYDLLGTAYGESLMLENYYYRQSITGEISYISENSAYGEMDLDFYLGRSDIVILEVNACVIPDLSFGFVDYVLEHPEYMDRNYRISEE